MRMGIKYIMLFAILVLLQVLVFNNIRIDGYANPQVYIFFLLVIPFAIKGYALLLTAFALGVVVDIFSDSLAIHTSASLFLAFCRPGVVRLLTGQFQPDDIDVPGFSTMGTFALLIYSVLLIFLHHLSLFFLEIFRFDELRQTMLRVLVSSGITFVFVLFAFAFFEQSNRAKRK